MRAWIGVLLSSGGASMQQISILNQEGTMAIHDEPERSRRERIERLRKRLATMPAGYGLGVVWLRDIIKGMLDLLSDEL
jgi:hypothetical protein